MPSMRRSPAVALPRPAHCCGCCRSGRPGVSSPPYRPTVLARAVGEHETVEAELGDAVARFAELEYPYWLAIARIDLADWLIEQDRAADAALLLDQAIETLTALGALPALARARELKTLMMSSVEGLSLGPLRTDGAPLESGTPAVEGGEGAAFAGEDMRPANPSHRLRSPCRATGEVVARANIAHGLLFLSK